MDKGEELKDLYSSESSYLFTPTGNVTDLQQITHPAPSTSPVYGILVLATQRYNEDKTVHMKVSWKVNPTNGDNDYNKYF